MMNNMTYISKNQNSDRMKISKSIGGDAESIFKSLMESKGCYVRDSSYNDNVHNHIDYYVYYKDKTFTFDVKRKHPDSVWIELSNVNGDKGSLYGLQTHVALYYPSINIIATVKRKDLEQFVIDNVIDEFYIASNGRQVPYHYKYTRDGNKDVLMKTKREYLMLSIPSYKEYNL